MFLHIKIVILLQVENNRLTECALPFSWGRALSLLSEFQNSLKHLNIARNLSPNNSEIIKELGEVCSSSYLLLELVI